MTEDDPVTPEESERLEAVLRERQGDIGHPVHYGLGKAHPCVEEPMGTCWSDDCLQMVAEDLADDNDYQGRCLHCRQAIPAKGGVQWRRTVRRPCPHCGMPGW